jgi:hypothetical protein
MGKDRLASRFATDAAARAPFARPPRRPAPPRQVVRGPLVRPPGRGGAVRTFRLIAPALLPLLLGGACFAIVVLVGVAAPNSVSLAVGVEGLGPLFFVFAAAGVVWAAALAYAPSDGIWSVAMFAGLIAFGTITLWAIFGPLVALTFLAGLAALLLLIVRLLGQSVLENTVHAMVLFGKHNRTLRPGFNLRWPGERVWAIISTADVVIEATACAILLPGGLCIDASATATCRAVPDHAHLTAPHAATWADHARRCLELTLRDTLSEMTPDELFPPDGAAPLEALAVRLRGRLQTLLGSWGIGVTWARLHAVVPSDERAQASRTGAFTFADHLPGFAGSGITPGRAWPMPDLAGASTVAPGQLSAAWARAERGERAVPRRHSAVPDVASGPQPVPVPALAARPRPARAPDVAHVRTITPGAVLPLPPARLRTTPAPQALADAYDAVRDRRITDPATIARIATAFETLAGDPMLSPHLPFDAHSAAHHLRELSERLRAGAS